MEANFAAMKGLLEQDPNLATKQVNNKITVVKT